MYQVGEENIPLCLSCFSVQHHMQNIDFLKNAMMQNNSMDDMDMMTGISLGGGRIPVAEFSKAIQRSPTLNSIHVSNSQIGVLNTGAIQKIDAAITLSQGSDAQQFGQLLKEFTELVISTENLSSSEKNEVFELTEAVAEEVVGKRRILMITALLKSAKEKVGGVLALSNAAVKLLQAISSLPM
jgi:hypothetical protein